MICKYLTLIAVLTLTLFSCEELESVNPADPAFTLDPPTLLSVDALTDTRMEISWKNNEQHTKEFVVQRKSGSESYRAIETLAKDILTFIDTACVLGVEYSYVVQSKVESNVSANSNTLIKATTFPGPGNLNVIIISDESIRLTWTDNTGYESGFTIERDAGSGFTEMGTVLSDVTELTDTGLTFGQSYSYRVAAFTSVNTSTWATIVSATEFPAPTNLAATTISDSEVELSWSDNCSFEDGYRIERNSGAGFIQAAELPPNVTEYIDTGLIGNLDYNYRVAAYTVTNTSAFCPTATVSTYGTMVDQEGNTYFTIQIGNQEWMAENLKVTHFRDGTAITNVSDDAAWAALTTEAYCIYNNNASDEIDTYGALYNWYAAADSRNIAPEGWHVPTDAEWKELEMALGMSQNDADDISYRGTNEGIKLSGNSALWDYGALEFDPEFGSSSFTALPGGYRYYLTGYYYKMGFSGYFWSATEDDITDAWYRQLDHSHLNVFRYNLGKTSGYSIRCLKD